ncbi:MAG: exodeoxyribonuclease VII large subunit, partial [Acidobacteriota bacterium]|nr:exodeoxyribonuclease VII large subunit [Acidobacteriota bacterium]
YPVQGRYQLVVETMEPRGRGAAALALEQLKNRLAGEGLFAPERKRPLPLLPRRIGVATSTEGAALRDVLRVLRRRFAGVQVLVAHATVQGEGAPASIAGALDALDTRALDVLLLVRGGGSREDLAAFDDERVVRAIAACATPLVTGVGHETDTTLADLAADVRAATPSAAAEIVVRERDDLRRRVSSARRALAHSSRHVVGGLRTRLVGARGSRGLGTFPVRVQQARMHLGELVRGLERRALLLVQTRRDLLVRLERRMSPEELRGRLAERRHAVERARRRAENGARRRLSDLRARLARHVARLDAMSPLAVLDRGYAIVTREDATGPLVEDAATLSPGDLIHVRLRRGAAAASVKKLSLPSTGESATGRPAPDPGRARERTDDDRR